MKKINTNTGFTIVELIIVIAVIAILAAISIISYNGVTQNARKVALQSDIKSAVDTLEARRVNVSGMTVSKTYPATLNAAGITFNPDYTATYITTVDTTGYCLEVTDGTSTFFANSPESTIQEGGCNDWASTNPVALDTPPVVSQVSVAVTSAVIRWDSVEHAASYVIERDTVSTFNSSNLASSTQAQATGTIQKTMTGLQPSTTYYFRVKAKGNGVVESTWSNTLTVTTPVLSTPSELVATAQTTTSISWSFNSVAGAASYDVELVRTSACNVAYGAANITTTTPSSGGLTNGTIYCYRVRAVAANGTTSAWSSYVQSNTLQPQVSTPSASPVNLSTISLSWGAVSNTANYEVSNVTSGGSATTAATSRSMGSLTRGTSYTFRVRSISPDGITGSWSPTVSAKTYTDTLAAGDFVTLSGNNINVLYSSDMVYRLALQTDGNLVIYRNSDNAAQWYKGYIGGNVNYKLVMQGDCNLVMYNVSNGSAVWQTNTDGVATGCYAVLQTDNKIVVYGGGVARWWSN